MALIPDSIKQDSVVERILAVLESTDSSTHAKAMVLSEDCGIDHVEARNSVLDILNGMGKDERRDFVRVIIDRKASRELMTQWLLEARETEQKRIAAIYYLGGPTSAIDSPDDNAEQNAESIQTSDIGIWETLAKDPNPRIASTATEVMLEASTYNSGLFPFFMKYLAGHATDYELQTFELDRRYSDWNMSWLPTGDAVDVWEKVPADSLALLAHLLRTYAGTEKMRRPAGSAWTTLRAAPKLSLETYRVLIDIWNDAHLSNSVVDTRQQLIRVFGPKSNLPSFVQETLFQCMKVEDSDNESSVGNSLELLTICADHVKEGNVSLEFVAQTLSVKEGQPRSFVKVFLETLVDGKGDDDIDIALVPLLDEEGLSDLFEVWQELPQEKTTKCYRHSNGLYIERGGSKVMLDITSEPKTSQVLKIYDKVTSKVKAYPKEKAKAGTIAIISEHWSEDLE